MDTKLTYIIGSIILVILTLTGGLVRSDGKKGKTYSEYYGVERGKDIAKKIKESRLKSDNYKHKEETKLKISNTLKGVKKKPFSAEHINNLSKAHMGNIHSKESREKASMSHTGEKIFTGFKRAKNDRIRNSSRFKTWRSLVFERDNHVCQNPNCEYCGNVGSNVFLHPHHIIPTCDCLSLDWEEEVFDVDNGITYCKDYHLKGGLHGK